MGTMAEKLNKVIENKDAIKQALETPSNVMSEYSKWIEKYVQNQPTNTVTDGVCTNALDVPLVSLGIDGQGEQKQYSGKNLCSGLRTGYYESSDGSYHSNDNYTCGIEKINVNSNNRYVYSLNGVRVSGYAYEWNDDTYIGRVYVSAKESYTPSQNCNKIDYAFEDGSISKYPINAKVQIELGSTATEYEPYVGGQPSPNPDYPQDIEVIDGVNLFDINNYKLNNNIISFDISKLKIREEYTFSSNMPITFFKISNYPDGYNSVVKQDDNGFDIFRFTMEKNDNIPKNNTQFLFIGVKDNYFINDINDLKDYKIQITEGTTPKPYLPHGHIGLRQSGINEFDENKKQNDKLLTWNDGIVFSDTGSVISDFIDFLVFKDYIYSNYNFYIYFYDKDKKFLGGDYDLRKSAHSMDYKKFDISRMTSINNIKYFRVWFRKIQNPNVDLLSANIIISSFETPYEPYHSPKVYPINLNGNSISKVGDVKDLLKIYRNGDLEIEKKIGKVVLDGSEYWSNQNGEYDTNERIFFGSQIDLINANMSNRKGLCNYFKNYNGSIQSRNVNITAFNFNSEAKYSNYIYIKIDKDKLSTQDKNGFKQWLSEHPTEVDYQLAEPETIKLPSIDPIELWEGTNNFKLITNLDTTFEMEYVVKV